MDAQQDSQGVPHSRPTNACEACRAAKVKCQASIQLGICRRCLDSKRECIFKPGPRPRRPRQSKLNKTTPRPPPPTGPSKTFTIDVPMPPEDDAESSLSALRDTHAMRISALLPPGYSSSDDDDEGDEVHPQFPFSSSGGTPHDSATAPPRSTAGSATTSTASSLPLGASALRTPPASDHPAPGRPAAVPAVAAGMGVRPRFNLDSATALLGRFRGRMLPHFPALAALDDGGGGETVAEIAGRRPFVLLAVLAAASGGGAVLQGHSLYDEEFRKVLGLKFVAAGERSLELLQGVVVYCAWYPFHLRPKNRQARQYVRMAVDIVHDLELDQDSSIEGVTIESVSERRLEEIRAYLATYYLVAYFSTSWSRTSSLPHTGYTTRCCDLLERSTNKGDRVLAWLVRLQHVAEEIGDLRKNRDNAQSEYQLDLMLRGMDAQLTEWEGRMAPDISSNTSIRLSLLFARVFLSGAPLLKLPAPKRPPTDPALATASRADPVRLAAAIPRLHALLDFALALPAAELNAFTVVEWGAFILAVILGFRMSFPLPVACPAWDDGRARREIGFGGYLEGMASMGGGGRGGENVAAASASSSCSRKNVDVLSASKVVLEVVRQKYEKRLARIERQQLARRRQSEMQSSSGMGLGADLDLSMPLDPMELDKAMQGCPMMDGSLDSYFPHWDESFTTANPSMLAGTGMDNSPRGGESKTQPAGFPDLWATMTMGWALPDLDFNGLYVPN
ncbi:hypothetical protein QBC33DRAFT_242303 [Phialemonium atrogriseum]|uniref:Zn(2)-C6 fungal-type domain-containing protein n=1 Tax=Phialemonium atrogriseum TaxID=1093897 RepID=A0AAJ0BWZ0_9PEZI|nr:uncharacterized protein QBC33DRAFT_242303 [Phialemonium atrogriseum]KAK1763596.1 hypothetical protein QBC33DRAFT_242303 [Phialemonium atrogriseum]